MRLRLIGFLLFTIAAIAAPAARAAEVTPAGWEAGPASDATMDKGRRFLCAGPDCPAGGLSCLHAEAPGNPGKDRTLRVKDMLRPKGFPWKDFETWLRAKAAELKPVLAETAMSGAGGFSETGAAEAVRLGERDFLWRRYDMRASDVSAAVQAALWVTDNRLNTAVCVVSTAAYPVSKPRIEAFFNAMNQSPPAPVSIEDGSD